MNSLIYSLIYIMADTVLGLAAKMIDSYFSSQNIIKILIRNAILFLYMGIRISITWSTPHSN